MLKLIRIRGDSMSPRYQAGDYVLVAKPVWRKLKEGDDVVTRHPRFGTIIKRITQIEQNDLLLHGLNPLSTSSVELGAVPLNAVIGRVIKHFQSQRVSTASP